MLTVVIAVDSLGAGEAATGLLNAATGIGGIAAGIAAGWVVLRRLDVGILAGCLIAAVGLVVLGTTHDLAPALLAIGIAVGAILLLDVILASVLQRLVPDEERGRAMGVVQIPGGLASIAGAFMAPLIAERFGVASALGIIAVASAVLGLAAVMVLRPTGALVSSGLDPRGLELLRSGVFGGVLPIRIEAATRRLQRVDVTAGQRVIEQGSAADRVYIIDSGEFAVSQRAGDGASVQLRTMGPGEVFGEIGILSSVPRTATVTASSAGRLFALDRKGFLDLVDAGPGLTTQLLDRYRGTWDRA